MSAVEETAAEAVAALTVDDKAAAAAASEAPPAAAAAASGSSAASGPSGDSKPKKDKPKKEKKEKQPQGAGAGGAAGAAKKKETKLGLSAPKATNFSDWYTEALLASEMVSYYDVSGCYILRPWSFSVWESIQNWFDGKIKESGVKNAYFPLFITEDRLNTEKDHVEGFSAEVAWVTKSGKSELDRPIAIRPTSETVMYPYFANWVRSWRDLPLRLNQWTNVVRWEFKHPTPFIRTREFLWQEGHTAFGTRKEAEEEVREILKLYARVYTDLLAVPVIEGRKSEAEKFAGALYTTSVEGYVPEAGRGIQGATSHCLGQNFSKMFNIEFEAEDGGKQFAWQNSWGISTRSIGVMVMVHGDDKGLVMPPLVSPVQLVAIPIVNAKMTPEDLERLNAKAGELVSVLKAAGVRCELDARSDKTPGWKYNHWEVKGVPLRLELGPRDMEARVAVVARRDGGAFISAGSEGGGESSSSGPAKETVSWDDLATKIPALLEQVQADMFARAKQRFDSCLERHTTWEGFEGALERRHMCLAPWADEKEIEEDVRKRSATADAMGAKTLCIPFEQPELPEGTKCFASGKPAKNWALWGRSY